MRSYRRAAFAGLFAFALCVASADAEPSATFSIVAGEPSGNTVVVDLVVTSTDSLSDTQFTIDYPSARLEFESVEVGESIEGDFEIANVNDECCTEYPPATGHKRVLVQVYSTHWSHWYSGTVPIARLTFSKVNCGTSSLVLPNITALNHSTTVGGWPIYDPDPLVGDSVQFACGGACAPDPCEVDKAAHAAGDSVPVVPASWTRVRRVFQ